MENIEQLGSTVKNQFFCLMAQTFPAAVTIVNSPLVVSTAATKSSVYDERHLSKPKFTESSSGAMEKSHSKRDWELLRLDDIMRAD